MAFDRRELLRFTGATCIAWAAGATESEARQVEGPSSPDSWAVLVDTVACIGCRTCEWACNDEHELSALPPSAFEDQTVLDSPRWPRHDAFTVINRYRDPSRSGGSRTVKVQCMRPGMCIGLPGHGLELEDLRRLFPDGYHRGAVKLAGLRFWKAAPRRTR